MQAKCNVGHFTKMFSEKTLLLIAFVPCTFCFLFTCFAHRCKLTNTDSCQYWQWFFSLFLRISGFHRLSAELPKAEKVLVVERVIESLGLQAVRDSLVGTVEKRGISGGQRKRVNVGLEMVMEPSLLILDEPTSGLDSSSSLLLLRALRREALEGVNICTVVHQPR